MKMQNNTARGFSLIEFMLYVGMTTIILLAVGSTAANVLFGKTKFAAQERLALDEFFILEDLGRSIHSATDITTPAAASTSTVLSLETADIFGDDVTYSVLDGVLYKQMGTASSTPLSSPSVSVSNLVFARVTTEGGGHGVRVLIQLDSRSGDLGARTSFSSIGTTTIFVKASQ